MSKLHYFHQLAPDADDITLALLKEAGTVPPKCLLGGIVARAMALNGKPPCDTCNGPRARCEGTPKLTDEELSRSAEEARLTKLFLGEDYNPLDALLKKG